MISVFTFPLNGPQNLPLSLQNGFSREILWSRFMCKLSFSIYKVIFIATFAGHGLNSVWLSNDFCWMKPPESSKDGIYCCLRNRMRTNYCLCKNYMVSSYISGHK